MTSKEVFVEIIERCHQIAKGEGGVNSDALPALRLMLETAKELRASELKSERMEHIGISASDGGYAEFSFPAAQQQAALKLAGKIIA